MGKIDIMYERLALYGIGVDDASAMKELIEAVMMLDLGLRDRDFLESGDSGVHIRKELGEVLFYLLVIASKHGSCLECLSDIMGDMLRVREVGFDIIVPAPVVINPVVINPVVINTDNTLK